MENLNTQKEGEVDAVANTDLVDNLAISKLTPIQILQLLLQIPSAMSKHKAQYFKNRKKYLEALRKHDEHKAKKYAEFRIDRKFKWTQTGMDIELCNDPKYMELREELEKWELGCDYHKTSMDKLKEISITCRNYIDYQKFLEGENK